MKNLNFSNNEPATITENLRKVTKAIKNNLIITQGRKATEDKINLIKEIAVPYMASLKDFPESSEDYESMPDRVEAGREFLNGYAERARDFMERIGLEDPNLKQTLDNIIKEISAEEWANEATGAVIGSEYYSVASKIENLMIAINGSLYSPLLKQVTEAEEEARKKAEEGY